MPPDPLSFHSHSPFCRHLLSATLERASRHLILKHFFSSTLRTGIGNTHLTLLFSYTRLRDGCPPSLDENSVVLLGDTKIATSVPFLPLQPQHSSFSPWTWLIGALLHRWGNSVSWLHSASHGFSFLFCKSFSSIRLNNTHITK